MSKDYKGVDLDAKDEALDQKPKGKGKGKGKGKPKDKKDSEIKGRRGNVNDAALYYEDANLLAQVNEYSFEQFLGKPIDLSENSSAIDSFAPGNIMTIWMNPSVQPTRDNSNCDGINIAAQRNFIYGSANNAKSTQYGAQDPMILLQCMRSGLEYSEHLKRAFGIIYKFSVRNRDYPDALLRNMNIDVADFRANLANYRIRFNTLIALFDRVPFIKDIPIMDKAEKIYRWIYLDEDSPMAQTYMFVPYSVWQLDEAYNPQGIGASTVILNDGNIHQFSWYLDKFEAMISALVSSSLLNYVYADILRVAGQNNLELIRLETIPESYSTDIMVNEELRIWLHNCVVVGRPLAKDEMPTGWTADRTSENDLETNSRGDGINYHPMFKLGSVANSINFYETMKNGLVDFETMAPNIEQRVAATRLAARMNPKRSDVTGYEGVYSGDLPVLGDYYIVRMRITTGVGTTEYYTHIENVDGMQTSHLLSTIRRLSWVDQFNFAPITYIGRGLPDADGNYLHAIHGDLNYFTTLDYNYMKSARDAEMIGEFTYRAARPKGTKAPSSK